MFLTLIYVFPFNVSQTFNGIFFPKKSANLIFPLAERWLGNSCPLGSPQKSQEASESAEGARVVWESQSVQKISQRKSRAKAEGCFEKLWWLYVGVFFSMDFHGISLVLCYRKLFFNCWMAISHELSELKVVGMGYANSKLYRAH